MVFALRERGVRAFPALRTALWLAGYPVTLARADLVRELPAPTSPSEGEIERAATDLAAQPEFFALLFGVVDRRAGVDQSAFAWEAAHLAFAPDPRLEAESEIGRWAGEGMALPGFEEIRAALETATDAELERARRDLAAITELGRRADATRKIATFGRKADRGVRSAWGRGVELTLMSAPVIARLVTQDRTMFAFVLGALVAFGRRGLPHLEPIRDVEALEPAARLFAAYRAEVPEVAELLNPDRMRGLAFDAVAADAGDAAARSRVEAFQSEIRARAEHHRPEIEAFLTRHPEFRAEPEETKPT